MDPQDPTQPIEVPETAEAAPPPACSATAANAPKELSRRKFLIGAGAVSGAALAGVTAWHLTHGSHRPKQANGAANAREATGGGPFVLVTLYGGNDGINTVIPHEDPAYLKLRPTLGYEPTEVLPLADGLALNPQLKGMQGLWKAGQLAVVRGVGYPNPNLSHFTSTAIWQSGDPTDEQHTGWLGRWLDATGTDPMRAISVGNSLPLVLRGEKEAATALVGPTIELPGGTALGRAFAAMQATGADRTGLAADIAGSGAELLAVQQRLDELKVSPSASGGTVPPGSGTDAADSTPDSTTPTTSAKGAKGAKAKAGAGRGAAATDLGGQLDLVASLINAGAPTRVYSVSLSSFDTHAAEKANHERLLGELDAAVTSFLQKIATTEAGRQTVLLTVSEFGRRPAENASGGTDHGTAAPLFVAGHNVKGGQFYGDQPSLTKLDPSGNQLFSVDFRSVYATVLQKVVGVDAKGVLGGSFPTVPFV